MSFEERQKFADNAGKEILAALPPSWGTKPQRPATSWMGAGVLEILQCVLALLNNTPPISITAAKIEHEIISDLRALAVKLKDFELREVIVEARCPKEPGEAETGIPDFLRHQAKVARDPGAQLPDDDISDVWAKADPTQH